MRNALIRTFCGIMLAVPVVMPAIAHASPCKCQGSALIKIVGVPEARVQSLVAGHLVTYEVAQSQGWEVAILWCRCDVYNPQGDKTCKTPEVRYIWDIWNPWPPPGTYHWDDVSHGCQWVNMDGEWTCVNIGCS